MAHSACLAIWAFTSFFSTTRSNAASCSFRDVDVRKLKNFDAFRQKFEDEELRPAKLLGVTDKWKAMNWTYDGLIAKLGKVEVWPRNMQETGHATAARVAVSTVGEMFAEASAELGVFEENFCPITRSMEGEYAIPKAFQKAVRTVPMIGLSRSGTGSGFNSEQGRRGMAHWVAQVQGSTTWALMQPGTKRPEKGWPWPEADDDVPGISVCTLEKGDALFVPPGYSTAWRGESKANLFFGWQGETRPMGILEDPLNAIARGDADGLSKALKEIPSDGPKKSEYMSPCVNQAMVAGHVAILKRLQSLGASLDDETPTGATHLHAAAAAGQAEAVQYAIEQGADPSVKHTRDGTCPIHLATWSGHTDVLKVLLKKAKKNWMLKDRNGKQPLHMAAGLGHAAAASVLVASRAKIDAKDKAGLQPLHWAAEGSQPAMIGTLLDLRASIEAKNNDGETGLHRAAAKGDTATVDALLDRRADIEAARKTGQTAVHTAAYLGQATMLEHLHSRGALLWPGEEKGHWNPQELAASAGHTAVVDFLNKKMRTLPADQRPKELDRSAHSVIQAGHLPVLKEVLKTDIFAGPPEERHFGLAHEAIREGHLPIVKHLLLNSSVDLIQQRQGTGTLMQMAAKHGHISIIEWLVTRDMDVEASDVSGDAPLTHSIAAGHKKTTERLLALRANPDRKDASNATALYLAVATGSATTAQLLLNNGARMSVEQEDYGENATGREHIHVAAARGHVEMAKVLVEHQADIMGEDKAGFVPTFLAAENGHAPMLKALVELRADIAHTLKSRNESGDEAELGEASVFSIAGAMGHVPVLKYLLRHHSNDQIASISSVYAGTHGEEWQQKFDKAMNLHGRVASEKSWKDTIADPEKKKKIDDFNEYYRNLAPHERRVIDRQMLEKTTTDEAKRKREEKELAKRVAKPITAEL